jgi:membrane protein DedA with SNARE-associated domain
VEGVALTFLHSLVGATTSTPQASAFEEILGMVFQPSWNVEHRLVIAMAIVAVLFLSGVGLPLPEDIPLTLAGFTSIKQTHDHFVLVAFLATFVIVVIPILLGDMVAYSLGRRYGLDLRERFHLLRRVLTPARLGRVQRWFDHYGAFTIFLGRQVAGVRFVTFFTAGSMRVPLAKFVSFDFLGCMVSVPVWLSLGVLASRYGEVWMHAAMRRVGGGFMIGALAVLAVFIAIIKLRGDMSRQLTKPEPKTSQH